MVSHAASDAPWKALLGGAGNRHLVQFYEEDAFLVDAVAAFTAPALRAGEAVLLIPTRPHREAIARTLAAQSVDVAAMERTGQLVMLDADEMLEKLMGRTLPDEAAFDALIAPRVAGLAGRFAAVRAFGEMVDLLLCQGNTAGTVALEECWNRLGHVQPFTLLCGYGLRNFAHPLHAAAFARVCGAHSHVIPSEAYATLDDAEAQRRVVATLQQQAYSLASEVAARRHVEEQLQEALHHRDEFLSIAGHELKTPLTSLRLQLQLLERELARGETGGRSGRALETCMRQSRRLSTLVDELLDLTRVRLGRMELHRSPMDLVALCRRVVEQVTEGHTGPPMLVHADGPVTGTWDPLRLEQVVTNLVTNAVKYGEGKPIDVRVTAQGGMAALSVEDRGIGIRPEDQARIFGRFERAAPANNYAGLGLGLYIARQIVDAHGGTIRVASTCGSGTTFTVELPIQTAE